VEGAVAPFDAPTNGLAGFRQQSFHLAGFAAVGHPSVGEPLDTRGMSGVTIDDVRALASQLERSYEAVVRDRVKFRVGRIVYLAFSRDDTLMGFAFPKEEREALVNSEPHKFMLPKPGDMRYNWVVVRLSEIDAAEMEEIVVEAWRMVVPKKVFDAYRARERE
jgi:hypothetical protein